MKRLFQKVGSRRSGKNKTRKLSLGKFLKKIRLKLFSSLKTINLVLVIIKKILEIIKEFSSLLFYYDFKISFSDK